MTLSPGRDLPAEPTFDSGLGHLFRLAYSQIEEEIVL